MTSSVLALCVALQAAGTTVDPAAPPLEKAFERQAGAASEKYEGVVPAADAKNPLPATRPDPTALIWSGFHMTPEGGKVFFQTTRPVAYDVGTFRGKKGAKGGTITVFLRNCRIHLKNNRRLLDTRYFSTAVRNVAVRKSRRDVEIKISLDQAAAPEPRTEAGPDGSQFVVLDFPRVEKAPASEEGPRGRGDRIGEGEGAGAAGVSP